MGPALERAGLTTAGELAARQAWYHALLELLKVRARTTDDIVRQAEPFFRHEIGYDADAEARQWKDRPATRELLAEARDALAALPSWDAEAMEGALRALAERSGFGDKAGRIFQPLRVALTGLAVSPGIFDVLVMLGRERSLARIQSAVVHLSGGQA